MNRSRINFISEAEVSLMTGIIDALRRVSIICQWDVSRVLAACASRCAFTRAKGCDRHADAP